MLLTHIYTLDRVRHQFLAAVFSGSPTRPAEGKLKGAQMRKLAMGALVVGLFAACNNGKKPVKIIDGPPGDTSMVCNVLTQSGCATGQKCSWILDSVNATMHTWLGHIGCAPVGTTARGAACTYMMPGLNAGYDSCMKGDVCQGDL